MGQRLVVQIKDGDKLLATGYYHWCGYTESTLYTVKEILGVNASLPKGKPSVERAVQLLRSTGATLPLSQYAFVYGQPFKFSQTGLTDKDIKQLNSIGLTEDNFNLVSLKETVSKMSDKQQKLFHPILLTFTLNRTAGLIDVEPDAMQDAISWSELDFIIDLNQDKVDISQAFWMMESEAEYREEYDIPTDEVLPIALELETSCLLNCAELLMFLTTYDEENRYRISDGSILYSIA